MATCIPPQGGTVTTKEIPIYVTGLVESVGTMLEGTATPNPGWAFVGWVWDVEVWEFLSERHFYTTLSYDGNPLPADKGRFSNYTDVVNGSLEYRRRCSNLRAVFRSTGDDGGGGGGGSPGGGSSGGSAKYYAAVSLSVRGEAARNAGCKVSVSGEPFALDSQSCVVLDSPGEVAFTLAYKESAQFKFSEYQDENGNTVTSPVILTASTSGAIANVYAIFEGDGRQILHGASNTILHGRNKTILHLE